MSEPSPSCKRCCTQIEGLGVRYGSTVALEGVNLHFHCGELTALVGPNGAGKSSLLRAILGELPHAGAVRFLRQGAESKPQVGYLPQKVSFGRDEPVSALDLLAVAISRRPAWLGVGGDVRALALQALRIVSAEHLLDRRVGALSGGELQRVLLALAMTPLPQLLLLDECTAGVDPDGIRLFHQLVCDLRRQHDIAILMVTHDVAGILPHADRIVVLNRSVLADGTPREVFSDPHVRSVIGAGLWSLPRVAEVLRSGEISDLHDGILE
jgi:zinc transport system ATP-binding protein